MEARDNSRFGAVILAARDILANGRSEATPTTGREHLAWPSVGKRSPFWGKGHRRQGACGDRAGKTWEAAALHGELKTRSAER